MTAADYLAGVLWTVIVGAAHLHAALRVQRALLGRFSVPGRALATAVLALMSLIALGQLLGAVGLLSWWPMLAGSIAIAVVVGGVTKAVATAEFADIEGAEGDAARATRAGTPFELLVSVVCVAAVGWQWTTHLADAFSRGMVQADNLWYHGPFTARFLQTGDFGDLGTLGYSESRAYPFNSELLHALMTMPFGRDVLVPVTSHLFAALALGAAWVLGRRWGVAALTVLAATVLLSMPLIASTQPGQMYNDVMAAALLLAAVALLVDGGLHPPAVGVAGAALGGAIGTKLSVLPVAAPLALGVLMVALVARRRAAATVWFGATAVTGGFWFARNWAVHRSPVPYLDVDVGPLELPGSLEPEGGQTLLETLDDLDELGSYYADSVRISLGPLWFLAVLLGVGACGLVVARARDWRWIAGLASAVGLATFPVMPITGGLPFVNNLRYGVTPLLLALVLGPSLVAHRRWARLVLTAACGAIIVANLVSDHRGRVPAWPGYHAWGAFVAVAIVAVMSWRAVRRTSARPRPGREVLAGSAAAAVAALAVGGWFLQDYYLDHRYVDSGIEEDPLYRPFRSVTNTPVDVLATPMTYPMFGADLSNDVTVWNDFLRLGAEPLRRPCVTWRGVLEQGPGYIAIGDAWLLQDITPTDRARWFGSDASVRSILDTEKFTVYYHGRALDPTTC